MAAPFAFGQSAGGIGGGFYTEGVDYAGFTLMQRGDNPDAIVQYEVQPEGTDAVFTTGETLRLVTQGGSTLANAFAARLSDQVTLAVGQTITLSFKFRYIPPLIFGTENQDIYLTRVGLFTDTDGGDLIAAYKAEDAAWAGYYGLIWMDDSVMGDFDPPRTHLLRLVVPGAAGSPLNKGTNFDESASSTSFLPDEDVYLVSFSVTKTAEGSQIDYSIGKESAEPSVALSYLDTNALDAVDTFDTFTMTFQGFLELIMSDLTVEVSGGGDDSWYGYDVLESGDANTGDWLGWVSVINDPWIWSYSLSKYIYVGDGSGWVYIPN
jgi:hypothetical protein